MPRAIICESNLEIQKNLMSILKALEIHAICPKTTEEAIGYLEVEDFEFVIVNENFADEHPEKNRLIKWITNLPMYRRREIMLVIIGQNYKSFDRLLAFAKGANLLINIRDLGNFFPIFNRANLEYQATYKQFKESL